MLPLLVLPFLFASCDKDDDCNPTLDLSHVAEASFSTHRLTLATHTTSPILTEWS